MAIEGEGRESLVKLATTGEIPEILVVL